MELTRRVKSDDHIALNGEAKAMDRKATNRVIYFRCTPVAADDVAPARGGHDHLLSVLWCPLAERGLDGE